MPVTVSPAESAFLLHEILGFDELERGETEAVLDEATKVAEGVLAPLDRIGDVQGSRLVDGKMVLPDGFADAFHTYAAGGWVGIAADPDHGGQGLSHVLGLAAFEPISSANMGFGLCPMLTQDAIALLSVHGTEEQKARLMAPMITGRWTGTMCLTEPQSGSDLSGVRTRAEPLGEGKYAITGTKIFITWGEHDITENICHLVLARLPDAPAGSAGISLFAVTKYNPDRSRNPAFCVSVEHKIGIHASPTCVMSFEGATGEMVGAPHRGLPAMFAMMNAARLGIAMQGVALAERAYRRAAEFSQVRVQGGGPIAQHPDVRRMLWTMRALALGGRLLTLYCAGADEARAQLLIPVAKAWSTDAAVEAASLGVQIHGGMGFVEETGAGQHYRDARIAPIYEGTNGIQAITLVRRGLLRDQGAALAALLAEIRAEAPALEAEVAQVEQASAYLRTTDAKRAEAGAHAFLQAVGTLVAGWLCGRVAAHAEAPAAARAAAEVFADQLLPRVAANAALVSRASAAILGDVELG
jgi:alkylation response protein AidB-like acyl-CoA dehydrogenase